MSDLSKDYGLEEVSDAIGMSTRWIRDRVKGGAEHLRYGNKIRFTAEQVEKLRAAHVKGAVPQSVTTGRGKGRKS